MSEREYIDLERHPELEPTNEQLDQWLGRAHEDIENGAEPDDALDPYADREFIEPPEWEDPLDTSHRELVDAARRAGGEHTLADRELEAGG